MSKIIARNNTDGRDHGRAGLGSLLVVSGGGSSAACRPVPRNASAGTMPVERQYCAGQDIPAGGANTLAGYKIKTGWVATYSMLEDGRRQLIYLYVPGDIVLVHAGASVEEGHRLTAITNAIVVPLTADALPGGNCLDSEALGGWVQFLMRERSILSERIVSLGRRTAYERTAHLLVELCARLDPENWEFGSHTELPVTQEMLADLLGLSLVHVNRTLRRLRKDGHVATGNRCVVVHSPIDLVELGAMELDPALYSRRKSAQVAH